MDARKETNGVVESSKLIIEKHGGSEGLAKRLKTNLQVSDHRQNFYLSRIPCAASWCTSFWERFITL